MPKEIDDRRSEPALTAKTETPDPGYKIGPGRPPKEYQFKPGQSGNPKGAKRKPPSIAPDLKAALERALSKKITLKQGEKKRIVTMATAGIEQLIAQFAKGDRYARRDLFAYADKLGVDLLAGQRQAIEQALAVNHQAILSAYIQRQSDQLTHARVFAPRELSDDDADDKNEK